MPEPAKDTAIDIAPKTQPTQGRVPKIVAEINRVASRVRDRNKKEEDHDAEVLENDAPTPSRKLTETIRIVRENTHRRRGVDKVIVGLLVFISVLLLIGCVLLGLVLKDEDTKSSPSPPSTPPPPSREIPNSNAPKCVPPGGDKLRFDGTSWSCVCEPGWTGKTCETGPTLIPDANFKTFVSECLEVAPYDGECKNWNGASTYGTMPWWNTSLVTNMNGCTTTSESYCASSSSSFHRMFNGKSSYNGDISKWDTSGVTNMQYMFYSATSFNQPIGSWDTSKVTSMRYMFYFATSFNHYVGDWDTSSLSSYSYVFNSATSFQAKYTCAYRGYGTQETPNSHKPSWCKTVRSDWVAPAPPPSS